MTRKMQMLLRLGAAFAAFALLTSCSDASADTPPSEPDPRIFGSFTTNAKLFHTLPVFKCVGIGFSIPGDVFQCWAARADGLHIKQQRYRQAKIITDWEYTVQPKTRIKGKTFIVCVRGMPCDHE